MALIPSRMGGLRITGARTIGLFSKNNKVINVRVAYISGKAMKTEADLKAPKIKPWPYKEKGFGTFTQFIDGTRKRFNENTKVVLVEGPVACGKTAFAKGLAADLEMKYFPMVNMDAFYVNEYGYDLRKEDHKLPKHLRSFDLDNFIQNPLDPRAIQMQFHMLFHKYSQYVDALAHLMNTGEGVVLDRSWYSDMVFAEGMHACGYMDKRIRDYYFRLRDNIYSAVMKPHLVIYLDAPVSVVETNLKNRGKGEEKTLNTKFLETMEHTYKQQYLKTISEHAELLIYDWSEPGDPEVVVEDIERIDFERFTTHDLKMEDWRMEQEYDWAEKRYFYTDNKVMVMNGFLFPDFNVPEVLQSGEDSEIIEKVWGEAPGMKYTPGYNADMGDTGILFKTSMPRECIIIPEREEATAAK